MDPGAPIYKWIFPIYSHQLVKRTDQDELTSILNPWLKMKIVNFLSPVMSCWRHPHVKYSDSEQVMNLADNFHVR